MSGVETEIDDTRDVPQKERFFRYFQHEVTALQEQIGRLGNFAQTGGERADAIDHCLAGIARLSHEVNDASVYLPAYDQRTYTEAIKALQEKLTETKASLAPRQKFAFKTARKTPSAISLNDAAELAAQRGRHNLGYRTPGSAESGESSSFSTTPAYIRTPPSLDYNITSAPNPASTFSDTLETPWPADDDDEDNDDDNDPTSKTTTNPIRRPTFSQATSVSLTSHSKSHIIVPTSASHSTMPASITLIKSSIVDIAAPTPTGRPFASLTIKSVRRSLLICGGVSGPAHITDVKDSVIVVNCRQLRMHQCVNVDIYLACSSQPIIEDCTAIKIGEFPGVYLTPNQLSIPTPNLSTQIQDFNNPAAASSASSSGSTSSPNFSILAPQKQIPLSFWKTIVSRDGFLQNQKSDSDNGIMTRTEPDQHQQDQDQGQDQEKEFPDTGIDDWSCKSILKAIGIDL